MATKKQKQKKENKEKVETEEKAGGIEIKNAYGGITDILDKCVKCGLCKSLCPVFKVLREETVSPRGKSILLSEKVINDIVFKCTLCKACELKCPLNIKVWEAVRKSREILDLQGKETEESKEMIKNVRETGNPFGKTPEKGKLYCC